ncbi:MAG: rod shape-determining protein MreD [Proteobacteria bacterium]|nr:rod shape-determining protein MreD [Pseudomonadota bacterium]
MQSTGAAYMSTAGGMLTRDVLKRYLIPNANHSVQKLCGRLGVAFIVGLIADLTFGSLLGEQALRLVVMTFILQRFRARLRFFPLSQQALAIGALLLNDRILTGAIHLILGIQTLPLAFWLAPLLGMLLWPMVYLLLDALRLGNWRKR